MSNPVSRFWQELRRRKVIRVAVAYTVVAWVIIEVASVIFPALLLPEWSGRLVIVLAALGFPAALVMAWVFEWSPEGLKRELPAPSPQAGLDVISGTGASGTVVPASQDHRRSIVVLPFTNLSTESGSEFFSDGITEEILTLLARQPDLRVVSRTTSFSFKGSQLSLRDIAGRLNTELVLEGSVRRAGRQLRIMAQLIDPNSDAQLWSELYDRELTDIFSVQAEIARCIVDALQLDPQNCRGSVQQTLQIEAYDYYLRGRQYFHSVSPTGLEYARQMFKQAIAIDPGYARAWAGLADTESFVAQWFDHTPAPLAAADEASRKALALAPDLAEAHSARGFALTLKSDFEGAARAFELALRIEPGNYNALYLYGRSRFAEGNMTEAAELFRRAHESQPDEFQAIVLRETALRTSDDRAMHEASKVLAVEAIRRRLGLNPDDQRAMHLGCSLLISAGHRDEGLALARRLLHLAPEDPSALYNVVCAFALAGEHEEALRLLERRVSMGGLYRNWVEHDPDFVSLRSNARFQELLSRMNPE